VKYTLKFNKTLLIASVALVFTAIALTVVTSALLQTQQEVPTQGRVGGTVSSSVDVGVYTNGAATTVCSNIDWGSVNPGSSVSQIVYIKNTGNTTETLSMTPSGWNPSSANSFLTLTWDKEGSTLSPGTVIPATFTISAAANTGNLTTFNFNILITGTA
jgi:hypothetical protein